MPRTTLSPSPGITTEETVATLADISPELRLTIELAVQTHQQAAL